jgi:hypothetical protein
VYHDSSKWQQPTSFDTLPIDHEQVIQVTTHQPLSTNVRKRTNQENPEYALINQETTPSKHTSQHTFRHDPQMSSDMFRVRGN